jgi:hypothetical protein
MGASPLLEITRAMLAPGRAPEAMARRMGCRDDPRVEPSTPKRMGCSRHDLDWRGEGGEEEAIAHCGGCVPDT